MEEVLNYYHVKDRDFTDSEVKIFIECLMIGKIDSEWILKCLTAVAINIGLCEEEYEEVLELDEESEDGAIETYPTSDFLKFVDQSLLLLLIEKDKQKWIRLYRDALLSVENYEMLHKLKLEQEWNI